MAYEDDITTMTVKKTTKGRFDSLGKKNESSDDLLNRVLDISEKRIIKQIIKEKSGG